MWPLFNVTQKQFPIWKLPFALHLRPGRGARRRPHAKGGYQGSRDEVERNGRVHGAIEVVTFYQGDYSESMKVFRREPVMLLFMDVDFEVSAQDMAHATTWIDPRSAIFSDETHPENFVNRAIISQSGIE